MFVKRSILRTIILVFLYHSTFAQLVNLVNIVGEVIRENKYTDIEGTPYLSEKFYDGYVLMQDGRKGNFPIKYDAFADKILYMHKQVMYELDKAEVREFSYTDTEQKKTFLFRNGFGTYNKNSDNAFYEVLYDGKHKLLKRYLVEKVTTKLFNSATTTIKFQLSEQWFIYTNKQLQPFKRNKKSFQTIFAHQPEVLRYIETQKLKLKTDEEIIKALKFLEGLE
ncbi:MAG: hypothetical protein NZ551_07740 [Microscillaceae bacterium]|nr:hypothetical protein [Microscillaceae bacterium]MDW8461088.1 hypothetical protein [Cytophagales bacterium]